MASSTPAGLSSKKKIIIVAAAAAAVVLVALGIILAIVLGNGYLDKMKDFDPVKEQTIYNGYEIVNEDGLYYLTKDGKKVSKTGYIMLISVNTPHYENSGLLNGSYEGVKFYDYFIGRKQDANTYFLIDGEGEELTVVGEDLEISSVCLPFVIFQDNVTGDYGVISLESLDSDISFVSDGEIDMDMFDSYSTSKVRSEMALNSILRLYKDDPGADAPKYIYVNTQGKVMFTSVSSAASKYVISKHARTDDEVTLKDHFYLCSNGNLYNGVGELLETDIERCVEGIIFYEGESKYEDFLAFLKRAKVEGSETEYKEELKVYAKDASFSISGEIYNVTNATVCGAVIVVSEKDAELPTYAAYDMSTGNVISECDSYNYNNETSVLSGVLVLSKTSGEETQYIYVDTETGKTLLTSKYGDMAWGRTGVMYSPTESGESLDGTTPAYFVAPGKTAVSMSFGEDERIELAFSDGKGNNAYYIYKENEVRDPIESTLLYKETRVALLTPFANAKKSDYYDKMQTLYGFAEGAPIILATDYASSKYEFIDVVNGNVVKTVSAGSLENMSLITVEYVDTHALFNTNDQGVELAVYKTVYKNASNDITKEEFYAFSRQEAMKGIYVTTYDEENHETRYYSENFSTAALTVTELGLNVDTIYSSSKDTWSREYTKASKYMSVKISDWACDVYEVRADLTISKICSVPYGDIRFVNYGTKLDEVYIMVSNPASEEAALYDMKGQMILGFHDYIEVVDEEYFIVYSQGVYGAFKYNPEKGRVKQILDFEFSFIEYVGDGGFVVYEEAGIMDTYGYKVSGEGYLYNEKKQVKSEKITADFAIWCYYVDEETGELMSTVNYYYNFEGELFVHRGEKAYAVVNTKPVGMVLTSGTQINNTAPTAIVYRDADGKVISSTMITTEKSKYEFKLADGTWYRVSNKKLQEKGTAVNEESIKSSIRNSNGGVINLYKAIEDKK